MVNLAKLHPIINECLRLERSASFVIRIHSPYHFLMTTYKVRSKVVPYPGMGAWHFLIVDKKQSGVIRTKHHVKKAGFGSIRVAATIGKSKWNTSIFPDKQSGCYLLPIKKQIRLAEGIDAGDTVSFTIAM